jgi:hypothetical protein
MRWRQYICLSRSICRYKQTDCIMNPITTLEPFFCFRMRLITFWNSRKFQGLVLSKVLKATRKKAPGLMQRRHFDFASTTWGRPMMPFFTIKNTKLSSYSRNRSKTMVSFQAWSWNWEKTTPEWGFHWRTGVDKFANSFKLYLYFIIVTYIYIDTPSHDTSGSMSLASCFDKMRMSVTPLACARRWILARV